MVTTVAALAALWFTNQSVRSTSEQYGLAQQTAITDRFAKAVEQLGNSSSLDIRLGGIYLLGRLMNDSPQDRSSILSVLGAFVRTHAPYNHAPGSSCDTSIDPPSEDVLAVLGVITTRGFQATDHVDLSNSCLANVDLPKADLRGISLKGANLTRADLVQAKLVGVDLSNAILRWANLMDADLSDSRFSHARMSNADFSAARLNGARIDGADLRNAAFIRATMDKVDFYFSDVRGTMFALSPGQDGSRTSPVDSKLGRWTADGSIMNGSRLGEVIFDDQAYWPMGFVPPVSDRPYP
ncbi:pentapeptide repeat-containing protein [Nocardia tengchongensis]